MNYFVSSNDYCRITGIDDEYHQVKYKDEIIPNYFINHFGEIKNKKGNYIAISISNKGYERCQLMFNNKKLTIEIHVLLMHTFKGYESGMTIDHINGDKLDNDLSNLEYVTMIENQRRAKYVQCKNYSSNKPIKYHYTYSDEIVKEIINHLLDGKHPKEISNIMNINDKYISKIRHRKIRKDLTGNIIFPEIDSDKIDRSKLSQPKDKELYNKIKLLKQSGLLSIQIIEKLNLENCERVKQYIRNIKI